ncbi:MAG TPA: nuclear transport factor 2 family protein [Candidatus Binatia bacterium]|jgi:ketosteroid isomerase-like protein
MQESEKLVRTFYDSTAPGHRERLCAIQAPDVVYDLPEGMPVGAGQFQGFPNIVEGFLAKFYGAFDVRFRADEYITSGDECVALGRIQGKARKSGAPVDVTFAHVWTVGDGRLQRLRAFTDTATMAKALARS